MRVLPPSLLVHVLELDFAQRTCFFPDEDKLDIPCCSALGGQDTGTGTGHDGRVSESLRQNGRSCADVGNLDVNPSGSKFKRHLLLLKVEFACMFLLHTLI